LDRFKVAHIEDLTTSAADHFTRIGFSCSSLLQCSATFRTLQVGFLVLIFSIYATHDNRHPSISDNTVRPVTGHWPSLHKIRHNDKLARAMEKAGNMEFSKMID